tara:strand:- start:4975 stop:6453 length:1479 start_codon:yes stop_codon:yes gene_type:complete
MANLLHLKASRTKVLNSLPTKNLGNDGDIVISRIKGRGVYLCTKALGTWHVTSKLSEISKIDKTPLDIIAKKLKIKDIKKSYESNKFVVSEKNGELRYQNSEEVIETLNLENLSLNYKTAYCSLGQYTNKKECEANNGTWYYSENDSHDSISSTAENQLLTIGQSIGTLDSEPTLLYDGSTLEIKRNTDYDDNWQTSAQDSLLKLSYDSTNNTSIGVNSSGNLTIDSNGNVELNADGGHITFKDDTTTALSIDIPDSTISLPADYKLIFGNTDEYIYGDGGKLNIAVGDGDVMSFYDEEIRTFKTLKMQERADAESDTAGYGQLWVDTATPNELAFTDDAGTDIIGIGKYHYECKFVAFNAAATSFYLPMNGYIYEQSLTASRNEYLSFIAPYNATIEKVAFRTEIAQDGSTSVRVLESSDATEIPGSMIFRKDHTYDIADDIYTEYDLTSPSVGSFPIPITKGRIYIIYMSFPTAPEDTNVNVVFKWDITS